MSAITCDREPEVVSVVLSGRWPDGCDEALRRHADTCAICGEVAAIASALRQDPQQLAGVPVPAAGQVWWRSAIRARAEAARAAARPMIWLQALTGAGAAGAAAAGIAMAWPQVEATVRSLVPSNAAWLEAMPLVLAVGIGLLAAPIAFYLAVPRD